MLKQRLLLIIFTLGCNAFPFGANLGGISDYATDSGIPFLILFFDRVVFVNQVIASRKFGQYSTPWDTTGVTYDS
jgi:hypothetical protein